jgi:hypothetical protein
MFIWAELLATIFTNPHSHQLSRSRWRIDIDGVRVGIVVAWRTVNYENHALPNEDMACLIAFKRDSKLDAAFVVAAKRSRYSAPVYVGYRDAEELHEELKCVPPRDGPFGPYWLLREDLSPLDVVVPDFGR